MDSDCLLLIDDLTHMSHTLVTMMAYLPSKIISGLDNRGCKTLVMRLDETNLTNCLFWFSLETWWTEDLMKSIWIFSIYTLQEWQNCDDEMIRHPTDHQGLFSPWALSSNWCVGPSPHINHSNLTIILTTQIISTTQIWITSTNTLVSLMKLIPGLLAKHILDMYSVSQKMY